MTPTLTRPRWVRVSGWVVRNSSRYLEWIIFWDRDERNICPLYNIFSCGPRSPSPTFFLDSELFVGITYTLLAYKFIKDAYTMPHLMNKGDESFKIDLVVCTNKELEENESFLLSWDTNHYILHICAKIYLILLMLIDATTQFLGNKKMFTWLPL